MEFITWFKEKVKIVDEYLSRIIEERENPQKIIYEAMNYSLLSEGKKLRPVLLLGAYELFRDDLKEALPFACAMEMIHTYSLIHDDLPAMDNDDYRRGKLSNHKKYGQATAILAGDGLLNKAFETGLEASINSKSMNAVKALKIIADSSGTEGMIGGQVVDMEGDEIINSIEDLKYMYSLKTGAIIKSSVIAGAQLAGADEEEMRQLGSYAEKIGIGFQIEDDILDVTGTPEKLGKAVGSDAANKKITYLTFKSIEEARQDVEKFTQEAIESLSMFGGRAEYLVELAKFLTNRER
ncbi:MAG TPA: polyprenyl synthetase family protein [Sedimentibacter sp.]|nr:polyprenyl synthetase family protein [Sedimentibacter sp.]HPW99282.1 polyprenyl synthetase family protein [Sedimentibacter sp.]HQB63724.1 polyprenyl synthetase family protein [Sedimentibacter sp.]